MKSSSRYGFPSLIAIFLFFLSLLNIANSSPLPDNNIKRSLAARDPDKPITQERYEEYLRKHWPGTDKYIFYSGGAKQQVEDFMAVNPGYNYYNNIFNAYDDNHPWYQFFDKNVDLDDGEASSKALANTATGDVLVFGAIEYKTKGYQSFFTREEIGILHDRLSGGSITSINHMAKDTTDASKIMAKEDADGNFAWQGDYKEGDGNASGVYGDCGPSVKRAPACDRPQPNPKWTAPETPKDPKSLQIISEQILCEGGPACDQYSWKFFEGNPGTAVDWCGNPMIPNVVLEGGSFDDEFPNGEWNLRFQGYAEDCVYKGHGEIRPDGDVGWLHCPERPAIKCIESPERLGDRKECDLGVGAVGVAHCDWDL